MRMMNVIETYQGFTVAFASTDKDLRDVQRLRYSVFVQEMGSDGPLVDHDACLEKDSIDSFADHLMVRDADTQQVVATYRLMQRHQADAAGGFYCATQYDLSPLLASGQKLLELGRSCVLPAYRQGLALHVLWSALAAFVKDHQIDILFGVASFSGTDPQTIAGPLSLLHHRHRTAAPLRVKAQDAQSMNLLTEARIDRRAAMAQMPALIKAYLRLGGTVGEGASIDHAFNTIDVCLMLETAKMNERQARFYTQNTSRPEGQ